MRTLLLLFCCSLLSLRSLAQDIDFKKGVVYIDGAACLKYDVIDPNNISFSSLEGKEIVFLKFIHDTRYGPLYNKVIFMESRQSFTSMTYIYNKKLLVKRLLSDGTLKDCRIDPEKVYDFILKYDERVEG